MTDAPPLETSPIFSNEITRLIKTGLCPHFAKLNTDDRARKEGKNEYTFFLGLLDVKSRNKRYVSNSNYFLSAAIAASFIMELMENREITKTESGAELIVSFYKKLSKHFDHNQHLKNNP